jgi:hypothetical protein
MHFHLPEICKPAWIFINSCDGIKQNPLRLNHRMTSWRYGGFRLTACKNVLNNRVMTVTATFEQAFVP